MALAHILIVEDDAEIRDPLERFLKTNGLATTAIASAEDAAAVLAGGQIDLVLLDLMLPGEDGLALCRRLSAANGPRIIMLTALSEPTDRVVGLELGADDYICKPFDLRELLARIRAVLRRPFPAQGRPRQAEAVYRFSGFAFFPQRRFLRSPAGLRVPLTGAEADLLLAFCQHPRKVLSRDTLINLTRGEGFAIAVRSVDILVSRLRRKLANDDLAAEIIRTVRSDGYVFQPRVLAE
ncbi:response regulator [Inquilinus sp. NPDC058860]|uniref:response regulator n=1 Tax=Inquilinus sp. NPDC058860 TaxID=3346652 RepID=UPI0036D17BB2